MGEGDGRGNSNEVKLLFPLEWADRPWELFRSSVSPREVKKYSLTRLRACVCPPLPGVVRLCWQGNPRGQKGNCLTADEPQQLMIWLIYLFGLGGNCFILAGAMQVALPTLADFPAVFIFLTKSLE